MTSSNLLHQSRNNIWDISFQFSLIINFIFIKLPSHKNSEMALMYSNHRYQISNKRQPIYEPPRAPSMALLPFFYELWFRPWVVARRLLGLCGIPPRPHPSAPPPQPVYVPCPKSTAKQILADSSAVRRRTLKHMIQSLIILLWLISQVHVNTFV